ncbi:T9SS type A sorting domain-containing protein [Flavobacterium johnsoniae]|uniref:T9SS type A sorting domain-containing protein n=1 Tax=Flavobacterium johnsoniae TaxID=986 RepID=UPI0025B1F791|nr:T9SS type A sorting domain-containing protein [Flavobacterium johnsoniae]WJS94232.1 T9SS type A sorting domain-containing protein [Flavobacterium johnsoniae]
MKYPRLRHINLIIIMMFFVPFVGISQSNDNLMETIITSGNNATGTSGTVAYSIGQVFYTYMGVDAVYNVAQGIQQQVKDETLDTPDVEEPAKAEMFVYPNPTADFVNISMNGIELEGGQRSYRLYDIQARLLKQNTINQADTQVSLNNLSPSIYILVVYVDNKILKSFKIIKN